MDESISANLMRVLKEFGVVGVVTYIGGLILLIWFVQEQNFQKQILLGIVGLILLSLSVFIAYFRLKIQKDREKALIEMEGGTCNRLAEQLGKGLNDKQIFAIIQKIRQTQNDLLKTIVGNDDKK
jgi:hypothetical protein